MWFIESLDIALVYHVVLIRCSGEWSVFLKDLNVVEYRQTKHVYEERKQSIRHAY